MLHETYLLHRIIGRGGFSTVYEAEHLRLRRKVAVKVLSADGPIVPENLERFRREAEALAQLGHPNIVDILDVNQTPEGTPYLVLEFLVGEALASRLRREGFIGWAEASTILEQVASALDALHKRGIVHRDLTPNNIFLCESPDATATVKIIDFGISKMLGASLALTVPRQLVGTPHYMSPEQARGFASTAGPLADVFALGSVVYHMVAGARPFAGESLEELLEAICRKDPAPISSHRQDVPAGVDEAVRRALAKSPAQRYASATQFSEAFAQAIWPHLDGEAPPRPAGQDGIPTADDLASSHVPTSPFVGAPLPRPMMPEVSDGIVDGELDPHRLTAATVHDLPAPRPIEAKPTSAQTLVSPARQIRERSRRHRTALIVASLAVVALGALAILWATSRPSRQVAVPAPPSRSEAAPARPVAVPPSAPDRALPAPALKAAPRRLAVSSVPAGAGVFVLGGQRGLTPLELALPEGADEVVIRKAGFVTVRRPLTADPHTRLSVRLKPVAAPVKTVEAAGTGALRVVASCKGEMVPKARVLVDGTLRGFTPVQVAELPAGRHRVQVESQGKRSAPVAVTIRAGETARLHVELPP